MKKINIDMPVSFLGGLIASISLAGAAAGFAGGLYASKKFKQLHCTCDCSDESFLEAELLGEENMPEQQNEKTEATPKEEETPVSEPPMEEP